MSAFDEAVENAWLGLGDTSLIKTADPLAAQSDEDRREPLRHLLGVMRRPENFAFTCKFALNKTILPFQLAVLRELWARPFPLFVGSRGAGKSWLIALYLVLRMLLCQGVKVVVVGAAFRQAKVIFEYAEEIWNNAPVLRDACGGSAKQGPRRDIDRCTLRIGDSFLSALPLGTGEKIRGQRANIIVPDEFAAIPNEIFENVVSGFASVSMDPVAKLQSLAKRRALIRLGRLEDAGEELCVPGLTSNQTVLTGTAYYTFNHFHAYWKRWKGIVESKGDRGKLEELFSGEVPDKFNWRDYSVVRLPVELLPEGFMDEKHVAKARATIHLTQYMLEYGAVFCGDSNGFFKRSLIESCVVGKPDKPVSQPSCGEVLFTAMLRGDPNRRYVFSIDPASEKDNFSITVLELWPDHRRVVHCWTTTRTRHKAKLRKGLVKEENFYHYAARKVRELMKLFPCERLTMDSQGGGVAVMEALGDSSQLQPGEQPVYHVVEDDKPRDTDSQAGLHLLELVNFARAEWVSEANHGMRKDLEDRALLFPEFDPAVLGVAMEEDRFVGRVASTPEGEESLYDTLEDCVMEIEELKEELATIVHTQTGTTMRDRWDTPEVKQAGGRKGRLRKDRYSSLLMANMAARTLQRAGPEPGYACTGGFAHEIARQHREGKRPARPAHRNPDWYDSATRGRGYGAAVRK